MHPADERGAKESEVNSQPDEAVASGSYSSGGEASGEAVEASQAEPFGSFPPEWQPYVDRVAERLSEGEAAPVIPAPRRLRRSARILIVDDEQAVCDMLAAALQEQGFLCDSVFSGTEAIAKAEGQLYDLAIVDLVMPDMNGLEVLRQIRRRHDVVRVIIMSGYGDLNTAVEALRARADDFIVKPIKMEELLTSVQRALSRQEALRGIRLTHQQLSQQLTQMSLKLQRRFTGGVVALATALEARDTYTKGHSARVATTCVEIGRKLDMHGKDLDDLAVGALLHDIGKIAVPDGILLKEGRLSQDEFRQIQGHPAVGYDILNPFFGRGIITDCALYHHERCDGTGYPKGLKGDDLPTWGKIISLCDAFDAMSSARPYRGALSEAEALREIEKNRGTQFDPQIADVFCEVRPYRVLKLPPESVSPSPPPSQAERPGAES